MTGCTKVYVDDPSIWKRYTGISGILNYERCSVEASFLWRNFYYDEEEYYFKLNADPEFIAINTASMKAYDGQFIILGANRPDWFPSSKGLFRGYVDTLDPDSNMILIINGSDSTVYIHDIFW